MTGSPTWVVPPPDIPWLPVQGQERCFPVHRIYCVGRNYAAHAVEMGHDPDKEPPFFFQKNPDNLTSLEKENSVILIPSNHMVHHEIELVVAIDKGGNEIEVGEALKHVFGYAVGLDLTQRDIQAKLKKAGRPWEVSKAFEHSAPCTAVIPAADIGHPDEGLIELKVNGEVCQSGNLNQMIWKVPEIISYLSKFFVLRPGDLIMTGTPSGVGPLKLNDVLEGTVEGIGTFSGKADVQRE